MNDVEADRCRQPAFMARKAVKNPPHLFEVYFTRTHDAWFIRVGGTGAGERVVAAHGGLIGALAAWRMGSRRRQKEQAAIAENTARTLEQMIAGHPVNHVLALADMTDPALEAGGREYKKGTVIWSFQLPGEKNRERYFFHTQADAQTAMTLLPRLQPKLKIEVRLDPKSGKYLKSK